MNFEHSNRDVYMSCGHFQNMDMMTTGKELTLDLSYYARQGLCKECWAKLRQRRAEERQRTKAEKPQPAGRS